MFQRNPFLLFLVLLILLGIISAQQQFQHDGLIQHFGLPIDIHPDVNDVIIYSSLNILTKLSFGGNIQWRQIASQSETAINSIQQHNSIFTFTYANRPHSLIQHVTNNSNHKEQIYLITRQFDSKNGSLLSQISTPIECIPTSITLYNTDIQHEQFIIQLISQESCNNTNSFISFNFPHNTFQTLLSPPSTPKPIQQSSSSQQPRCTVTSPTTITILYNSQSNSTLDISTQLKNIHTCWSIRPVTIQNDNNIYLFFLDSNRIFYIFKSTNSHTQFSTFEQIYISYEQLPYSLSTSILPIPSIFNRFVRHLSTTKQLQFHPNFNQLTNELVLSISPHLFSSHTFILSTFYASTMKLLTTYTFVLPQLLSKPQFSFSPVDSFRICIHAQDTQSLINTNDVLLCIPTLALFNTNHNNLITHFHSSSLPPQLPDTNIDYDEYQSQLSQFIGNPDSSLTFLESTSILQSFTTLNSSPQINHHTPISNPITSTSNQSDSIFAIFTLPPQTRIISQISYNVQTINQESIPIIGFLFISPQKGLPTQLDLSGFIISSPSLTLYKLDTPTFLQQATELSPYLFSITKIGNSFQYSPRFPPLTVLSSTLHNLYNQPVTDIHQPISKPFLIDRQRLIGYLEYLQQSKQFTELFHNHLSNIITTNCPQCISTQFDSLYKIDQFKANSIILSDSIVIITKGVLSPTIEIYSLLPSQPYNDDNNNEKSSQQQLLLSIPLHELFPFIFKQQFGTPSTRAIPISISPTSLSISFHKNRISILYSPYKDQSISSTFRNNNPPSYILTIDLYRLSQTPIIIPITSAIFSHTPLSQCIPSSSQMHLSTTTLICYNSIERQLIQLPEHILTPPIRTTMVINDDNDDETHITIPLLHQIQDPLPYEFIISGTQLLLDQIHPKYRNYQQLSSSTQSLFLTNTKYESTSNIYFHGIDFFTTTLTRDGSFDRLNKSTFNYWFLIITIIAVIMTFLYSQHRARVSNLENQWK